LKIENCKTSIENWTMRWCRRLLGAVGDIFIPHKFWAMLAGEIVFTTEPRRKEGKKGFFCALAAGGLVRGVGLVSAPKKTSVSVPSVTPW